MKILTMITSVHKDERRMYFRIRIEENTEKKCEEFKEDIKKKYLFDSFGFEGHICLKHDKFIIDVIKSGDYLHIEIMCDRELRDWFSKLVMGHFKVASYSKKQIA